MVKVRFEQFIDALNYHKTLNKKTLDYAQKNNELRKEADEIILSIWNEVEERFTNLSEEIRRKECEEYGLIYFFRKGELNKSSALETQNNAFQ